MTTIAADTPWLTVAQAAAYMQIGEDSVRSALATGELQGFQRRAGGHWRLHRDACDSYLKGEVAPIEPPRVSRARR